MRDKLIHSTGDQRTFVIVLESGEEVMSCLQHFAAAQHIDAAQITAIGAFSDAELAYFDWEHKKYLPNKVDEQVEVAAFAGDVALGPDGKVALHVHCVLGRRDGSALAGHLTRGHVRPTLEIVLIQSPGHLRKRHDADSGLALIDLDSSSP
jgi:predicted DNA-binding protein with PD1-like motif